MKLLRTLLFLLVPAALFGQAGGLVNGTRGFPQPNNTSTGTTLNGTAVITAGLAINAGTSNTTVPAYIVIGGAGTSGNAVLASDGSIAPCIMDSTISSGASNYYVINSTTTAKECHAQSAAPSSGVWIIGFLSVDATTSGSTANVAVHGAFYGGGGTPGTGPNDLVQLTSNSLLPAGVTTTFWSMGPNQTPLASSMVIFGPVPVPAAITIPTNGTNSQATSQFILGTLPTASWTATLYHIAASTAGCTGTSTSMGTVAIATTGAQTWSLTQTSFAVGDCLEVVAPSSVDTTAANPNLTLAVVK